MAHSAISQMGISHRAHLRLTAGERHAEEEHADELLPVLRAVHEGHGRRAADLRRAEALVGAPALGVAEEQRHEFGDDKAQYEAQERREHQAVDDLEPFAAVDAGHAVVQGDGRAGKTAMSAWLSLVGMPNFQAAVAHVTMATIAAQSATSAS